MRGSAPHVQMKIMDKIDVFRISSLSCPPIPLPATKRRLEIQLGFLGSAVSSSRLHKMVKNVN